MKGGIRARTSLAFLSAAVFAAVCAVLPIFTGHSYILRDYKSFAPSYVRVYRKRYGDRDLLRACQTAAGICDSGGNLAEAEAEADR